MHCMLTMGPEFTESNTAPEPVDPRLIRLKQMVLDAVTSTDLERTRQRSQRSRIV